MLPRFRNLSVKLRLSIAILTLCAVTLVISGISLMMLRNAENWLDTIHRETLTEVSQALELSRNAADLATAAPFLLTVQLPFQQKADADAILQTLAELEEMSTGQGELALPIARMRAAIANLLRVATPQNALQAQIAQIDGDLKSLHDAFARQASAPSAQVADRLIWAALSQLTSTARSVARAQDILEVGELSRRYSQSRAALPPGRIAQTGLREVETLLSGPAADLFQLKYQSLTAALDAENALFRIRQLSGDINALAALRVEAAQERLRIAQMQTSRDLDLAQSIVGLLALFSAGVAALSALFVSRYVARNLRLIADGMHQLASGDHSTTLAHHGTAHDEIGRLFHAFGVFRDNARKLDRRTAQIRRQNTLFASVFRNIKDGVAILAPSGEIEAENDKINQLLHLPSHSPAQARTMQGRIAASAFRQHSIAGDRGGFEEYTNPAGDVLELRQSQLPDGRSVWLLSETTERKRIEERLEEIRRVETLGKVTGEVAHDFGNILSTISGNLHLLETMGAQAAPAHLGRIRTAVDLGVSLTERLVAFARKQHLEPEVVDLAALIEGMVDLLDIALPETVTLHLDLGPAPLHAALDPGQLESAILNLCMNAAQAISGAGNIWITLAASGGQAALSIKDDGAGMTEETRRRAFEPFYSARPDGQGTGLGLSMVFGFATQSGGGMDIRSALGQGAEITLRFPLVTVTPAPSQDPAFTGTALVVDDTAATAASVQTALSGMGFQTLTATSFAEAQTILAAHSNIGLILSDLNLDHGHSGLSLIQTLLARDPAATAILMSSRLPQTAPLPPSDQDRFAMLGKPVATNDLRRAIRQIAGSRK
ncbi:MAG: ATP-binding protein [Sulfitobacter sp.]